MRYHLIPVIAGFCLLLGCSPAPPIHKDDFQHIDTIITGGLIYDGSGSEPYTGGIAIDNGKILTVGDVSKYSAAHVVDAKGYAVSPGFINMLSWGVVSLIHDGRGMSDISQGVTLEVFGEGISMGPLSPYTLKGLEQEFLVDYPIKFEWNTLGEYLDYVVDKGVSPNIASFVGATTLRMNQMGSENIAPTDAQLASMQEEVRVAMQEGALGVGSSLIYAPAFYAKTDELIAIVSEAAKYGGSYISHIRNEGNQLLEAIDELIAIAEVSGAAAEIYHLKASGENNWPKMALAIDKINAARARGLNIRADIYTYPAGSTGLDAAMPPWVQAGGYEEWRSRLLDPTIRQQVKIEMQTPNNEWDNLWLAAGTPERILFSSFKNPELKPYTGKTLAEVMQIRGTDAEDTMIDLVIADGTRVGTIYFLMSEDNIALKIKQPWLSFGSDSEALAPEGEFLKSNPHPRAYGTFTRLLGHYVREKNVISLQEAVRRLTTLPAENLKLKQRGALKAGYAADIVVFNPDTIIDKATFAKPHQLASGVEHVWVNGQQVLKNGQHTGAFPGQVVRGPGWTGWEKTEH
ncbi:MAG: N-acyl-D-amino-acid deacylase [Paraglaciecola sp.]|jgi:N-acyl-D-amino-acid deacylase